MAKATSRAPGPRIRKSQDSSKADKPKAKTGFLRRGLSKIATLGIFKPLRWVLAYVIRFLRWITPSYFINSWREVKQVTWPNRRETWRLTAAVFVFATVFGILVAVVDKGLDEIFKKLILK